MMINKLKSTIKILWNIENIVMVTIKNLEKNYSIK